LNIANLLFVGVTALACSAEVDERLPGTRALELTAPDIAAAISPSEAPKEWIDPKGHVWRRTSDQRARIATAEEEHAHAKAMESYVLSKRDALDAVTDLAKMDVADIVQMLRMKTVRYGYEYVSDPDPERAQALKVAASDKAAAEKMVVPPGLGAALPQPDDMPSETELRGQAVFGADGRVLLRSNTTYPVTTNIVLSNAAGAPDDACSASMIGASTAITSGHCLQTSSGAYLSMRKWAIAPDLQDATPGQPWLAYPYNRNFGSFPSTSSSNGYIVGCYAGFVPLGYNGSVHTDYAVIEFDRDWWDPSVCTVDTGPGSYNDHPGNAVGWRGLAVTSDTVLRPLPISLQGFPGKASECPGSNCFYPSVWAENGTMRDLLPEVLRFTIDATGGQSGSGLFYNVGAGPYVVGLFKGSIHDCTLGFCDDYNFARRISLDVYNNVLAFSEL